MPTLRFPDGGDERPGRKLAWLDEDGLYADVRAAGIVTVPDVPLELLVYPSSYEKPTPEQLPERGECAGWQRPSLTFIRDLPPMAIAKCTMTAPDLNTLPALAHLAPGLQKLTVTHGLDDTAMPTITKLCELRGLYLWGNHFTDGAVQQLAALTKLEELALVVTDSSIPDLTIDAFAFTHDLPALRRLHIVSVRTTPDRIRRLRAELPHVEIINHSDRPAQSIATPNPTTS